MLLSLGELALELPKANNVATLPFAPQLDVLTWTNAMVTHGGLGSVKEALQNGVPMLVYPFHSNSDMSGNAARIQSKSWGLKGNVLTDSAYEVENKVREVLKIKYSLQTTLLYQSTAPFIFQMDLAESK